MELECSFVMVLVPCNFLTFHILKVNKMHQLKHNKTDHKTHFVSDVNCLSDVNCYVFRHQGAIIREFINHKVS